MEKQDMINELKSATESLKCIIYVNRGIIKRLEKEINSKTKKSSNSSSKKDSYNIEEYRRFANTPEGQRLLEELGFKRSPS